MGSFRLPSRFKHHKSSLSSFKLGSFQALFRVILSSSAHLHLYRPPIIPHDPHNFLLTNIIVDWEKHRVSDTNMVRRF
ncbi:hypothetical protein HanRHA438_Chr12g0550791 [Helianthus annuus]|nr:hypothetical protein HanHA300_Chr12g0442281 [Helianthus annuus]KAJ0493035.1 hypothetical protein HanIR_Chr12g0581521 [Helianthus annuus]KAJ0505167.1 hypothetical protein HanHA89_Chr12g0467391 [Helianthus annuus]KAJ0674852.1 hypothetical protein HanLR1_Chr12g0444521 [Helianthus annuus]KAJ0866358.1 hypothetical protein HanRHA438_Chr12g0550791 [Helianthus annuus]